MAYITHNPQVALPAPKDEDDNTPPVTSRLETGAAAELAQATGPPTPFESEGAESLESLRTPAPPGGAEWFVAWRPGGVVKAFREDGDEEGGEGRRLWAEVEVAEKNKEGGGQVGGE